MTGAPFLPGLSPGIAEIPPPAQPYRPTSVAAAKYVRLKAGAQCHRILRFLYERGPLGATHLEVQAATGFPINAICGRFNTLRRAKFVDDSKTTRINPASQQPAMVWIITDEGGLEVERLIGA